MHRWRKRERSERKKGSTYDGGFQRWRVAEVTECNDGGDLQRESVCVCDMGKNVRNDGERKRCLSFFYCESH